MHRKINNKTLLIILVALVGIFLISRYLKTGKTERSFKTDLVMIDTSKVTTILLYPKAEELREIRFMREGNRWSVAQNGIVADTGPNSIRGLLSTLQQIKPTRLAARSSDRWEEYQLTDSLATRIKVIETKGRVTLDLLIGKFTYKQSNDPYSGYGGRGNVTGTTYVRLGNEEEIYAVEGFLTMSINRDFSYWRDQRVVEARKQDVTGLVFSYPADSGFVASKKDTTWFVGNLPADSLTMDRYLSSISYKNHSVFMDGYTLPSVPDYQLTIEGNNMSPVVIKAFTITGDELVITSSLNPRSLFSSGREGLFSSLFKPFRHFIDE